MTKLKAEVLALDITGIQSRDNAKARVLGMLDHNTVVANLIASRVGGSLEPSHESWLSPIEFDVAVTDPDVAKRRAALDAEGVAVLVFDMSHTNSGRRDRALRVFTHA